MKKTYQIEVDCANCANLMEEATKKTEGVQDAVVNFMTQKMIVEFAEGSDPKAVTNMTKKQKKVLWRIIATAVLVAVVKIFSIGGVAGTVLYLAAYLIIGYDILRKAFRGIIKGQVFDENFLMAVVPELRRGQEPSQHHRPDGHSPGLCQH